MKKQTASTLQCTAAACALVALNLLMGISGAAESAPAAHVPAAGPPPSGQYQLDKSHASLLVRASHFGFSMYTTRFSRYEASLMFDPKNIPASILKATIDASSFEMDGAPQFCLDIMKGDKYLDVARYPTIVFRSETVRMTGPKEFEIAGVLELHGVSRPLVLAASYNGGYPGIPDADPHARIGFSAHGSIKRSDFGMSAGLPAPGTTAGVGDVVDITIEAELSGPPLAVTPAAAH